MKDSVDMQRRAEAINDWIRTASVGMDVMCERALAAGSVASQVRFTAACIMVAVQAHMGGVSIEDAVKNARTIIEDSMRQCAEQDVVS